MKLDTKKYKFRYFHGAICTICGCEILKESESTKVLHYYEVPNDVEVSITSHLQTHYKEFDFLTDLYGAPSKKCKEVISDCYYIRIESETAFEECMADLKAIYDGISNREVKPYSEQDLKGLGNVIANCSFSDYQKRALNAFISELDDLCYSRRKELLAQEVHQSSQSIYTTGHMGIPGLGKRY